MIQFILENVSISNQNLGLFFLGIEYSFNSLSEYSCLNSIIQLSKRPKFTITDPELAEIIFELFYYLIKNPCTSVHFIDIISYRYHPNLLIDLLINLINHDVPPKKKNSCYILQRVWIMRCLALELHLFHYRTEFRNFIDICLFKLGFFSNSTRMGRLIIELLNSFVLPYTNSIIPIEKLGIQTQEFEYNLKTKNRQIDLRKLNIKLREIPKNRKNLINNAEYEKILTKVLQENENSYMRSAMESVCQSWTNLIEMILLEFNFSYYFGLENALFEILNNVLSRLIKFDGQTLFYKKASIYLASLTLSIIQKLRELLNYNCLLLNSNDYTLLCQNLCDAIIFQEKNSSCRGSLYTAMLGYFDFCEHESVHQSSNNLLKLQLHSESLKMKSVRNEFNINEINYKVISNCMPFILKIISRDMISKSTLLSTLSIAVITKIALLENKFSCLMKYSFGKRWFSFIVLEDRLIQLVHVLFRINQKLIDAIQNMRRKNIIYQFKSIMSFITEIATEKSCCTLLIDCNIFELWNNSSFLNKYFLNKILSQKEMSTNLAQSYFQLLNSSLRLIITMLMIYNNKIIHQLIFTFLLKHEDVFHLVLNRSLFLNISFQSIKFLLYVWKLCLEGPLNLIDRSNYPNKKNKYTCLLEKQNKTWKNIFKYIIQRINKTKKFNTSKQYRTWKDKTAINDEIYEILRILLLLFLIGTSFIFFNDCRFLSKVKKKMFTIAGSKKIFGPLPKTLISLFEIICIKLNSSISLKTELEFDQIQIKDSMEKYLPKNNDIHFQNHVLKKKYAENFLEIKLSKTNLCIQKLFSMIENIFFLFYCNCLFFFKIDDLEQKRAFRFFLFENISKIRFLNNRIQKNIKLIHGQSFFGNNYFLKSLIQKIEDLIK